MFFFLHGVIEFYVFYFFIEFYQNVATYKPIPKKELASFLCNRQIKFATIVYKNWLLRKKFGTSNWNRKWYACVYSDVPDFRILGPDRLYFIWTLRSIVCCLWIKLQIMMKTKIHVAPLFSAKIHVFYFNITYDSVFLQKLEQR